MKKLILANGLLSLAALFCCVSETDGRSVREALDVLLATEYCGTATFEGVDISSALRGETPVSDDGIFDVQEEEWLPVLLGMAEEELEGCKRDTAEDVAGIRRWEAAGEQRDNSNDEGTRYLWDAYKRVKSRCHKLMKIVVCLQYAEGGTEQVLDILERIGLESPPEYDLSLRVAVSMVKKACRDGQYVRCVDLGRRYRKLYGPGCREEWKLCRELCYLGLPMLDAESARWECYRYMLEVGESQNSLPLARGFDEMAEEVIPGWVGSVQRRRLAARFPDEPMPHHQFFHPVTGEIVDGEIDERRVPQMLNRRAAEELAADESKLTDLREVYGDWTQKGDAE